MSNAQPRQTSRFVRAARKFFVSGFVVFSFIAYALHEHFTAPNGVSSATLPTPVALVTQALPTAVPPARATEPPVPATAAQPTAAPPPRATEPPVPTAPAQPTAAPPARPTEPPTPTQASVAQAGYKDGEYAGPVTDAYYGLVQVKAVIQAGKIADVQFLQYPNDRRTSIRINNIAMPYLVTEALQAQSAQVDIISGATLTSQAFAQSLQSALASAKG
jgi:uncharacterized protein with FMN-binding domain